MKGNNIVINSKAFAKYIVVVLTLGFKIIAESPAKKSGTNTSATLTTDFYGNPRTLPFDIGAFEYVP